MAGTEVLSQDLNSLLNDFDNITLPETSSLNKVRFENRSCHQYSLYLCMKHSHWLTKSFVQKTTFWVKPNN